MRKPNAAFVVEIDAESPAIAGELHGRVEHVVSGASLDFDSATSLVGFIRHVIGAGSAATTEED